MNFSNSAALLLCSYALHVAVAALQPYITVSERIFVWGGKFQCSSIIQALKDMHMLHWNLLSLKPSECFSSDIMQTWSHSNKVGLFAAIEPRPFPKEIVVHEILTGRGVVHLGVFLLLLHITARLCSQPCFMSRGCFYSSFFSAWSCLKR